MEETRREALGRHLRALRDERRWTQEMLRDRSGVSTTTIRSIENNYPSKKGPTRATLRALSLAFDQQSNYFRNYLRNPPEEGPAGQFAATETTPQRPTPGSIAQFMPEVIARLGGIERHLGRIADARYPGPREAGRSEEDE